MRSKLGPRQRGLLIALGERHMGIADTTGTWSPRSGWNYGGTGATLRLLQGLHVRGLVEHDRATADRLKQPLAVCYKLTPAGAALALKLKENQ